MLLKYQIFIIIFLVASSQSIIRKNVCKHFFDYFYRDINPNCWFNPDIDTTPDLVAMHHGFQFQNYLLTTKDGYHLDLFRIQKVFDNKPKQPVLLVHDIFGSAMSFMLVGNRSLAFYLANKNYDVWLANMRGNTFSSGHVLLTQLDPRYWKFSYQEMAVQDIPVILFFIKKINGVKDKKITYIGHGMGATLGFMYALDNPKAAQAYLNGIISLGGVDSPIHPYSPMKYLVLLKPLLQLRSNYFNALFPIQRILQIKAKIFCQNYPSVRFCKLILSLLSGFSYYELLPEDIPMIFSHFPSSISMNNFIQYLQIISSNDVIRKFDYGPTDNIRRYNSITPPAYDFNDIKIPVHIYYGENDLFAGGRWAAQRIYDKLGCENKTLNCVPKESTTGYTHIDFIVGKNVDKYLYENICLKMESLEKLN